MTSRPTAPPTKAEAAGHTADPVAGAAVERRAFLRMAAAAGVGSAVAGRAFDLKLASAAFASDVPVAPPAVGPARSVLPLAKFPEKTDLLLLTDRPPNLETPLKHFLHDLTPNEAFFVRWHLGIVPTRIDLATFRLKVAGHVGTELSLSVDQLKKEFEPASVVAVCQCAGNSRSLFEPRVTGAQWGNGATGNAKWTGVRLADLLKKAGVKAGAVDVTFGGLDKSPMPTVAPFVKSIPAASPKVAETIVAYAMNDQPLPMLNGFPLRLVVPGWYATYWVKALNEIGVTEEPYKGFWMAKAYRAPATPKGEAVRNLQESPAELANDTVPISDMTCRSLVVTPAAGEQLPAGKPAEVNGVAWDAGRGIAKVEVSVDGGKTWADAKLGADHGKYSWRRFTHPWTPAKGSQTVMARATNAAGETQTVSQWNRSGYGRNIVEAVAVTGV
jgi:sulfite dehydrogenase